jgi:phosphate transport system substrate-binding protein
MSAVQTLFLVSVLLSCLTVGSAQAAQSSGASRPLQGKLTVSGAFLLQPLMADIGRRFESLHPRVKIDVRSGGSQKGMSDLRSGAADIGMVSRALLENERDLFAFHVARDGLAVVVHRDNPLKDMNAAQVRDVLTGRAANWKEFGGRDAPVQLAWRSNGQGSVEFVFEHFKLKREQIGRHTSVVENSDAIKFVAANPHAVTLASVGDAERSAQAGVPIKLLAYNGTPASNRNLQNRSYALSRPLTLVTRRLPEGLQRQFIDYALSNDVIDLLVNHGFVAYQD